MAAARSEIISLLNAAGIAFEVTEHQPIYTVEEGEALKLPHPEAIARTLFLCDDKHQNFWLVTLPKDKKAAEELDAMLNLPPGSVTPLGALNDAEGRVPVIIDSSFKESLIGVPLLTNTATIWLNGADLALMLTQQGHKVNWLAL